MALELIDKQDTFEIIRDQIAAILVLEVANQKALAATAGKNSALWDLKVYIERANPFEAFQSDSPDETPIVNIWFDNENFEKGASNLVERQKANGIFNIDVYAIGVTEDIIAGGHNPGDREAAINAQRAIRLVRNILMAAENTYLQLPRRTAWDRIPQAVTLFQPTIGDQPIQKIMGARLALSVSYNEFSPQVKGEIMELLSVDIKRIEDGQLIVEADYVYPIV